MYTQSNLSSNQEPPVRLARARIQQQKPLTLHFLLLLLLRLLHAAGSIRPALSPAQANASPSSVGAAPRPPPLEPMQLRATEANSFSISGAQRVKLCAQKS